MVRLEQITRGTQLKGILPGGPVTVVDVRWHGSNVIELFYKDSSGRPGTELVFRDREPALEIVFRYVYLPRLRDPLVLVAAVEDGVRLLTWMHDGFAYAEGYDQGAGRYRGLRAGEGISLSPDAPAGLLVRPEVARRQLEAETASPPVPGADGGRTPGPGGEAAVVVGGVVVSPPAPEPDFTSQPAFRRFYGRAVLDPTRVGRDAGQIAQEIIAHLAGHPEARVRVTLEIEAELPGGFPDHVVRTVRENCNTLKFEHYDFEQE